MNHRQTTPPLSRDCVHRILQEVEDNTFNGCVILSEAKGGKAISRQDAAARFTTGTLRLGEWVVAPGWWLAHRLASEAENGHGASSQFGAMQTKHAQWLWLVGHEPPRVVTRIPDGRIESLISFFSKDDATAQRMRVILAQIPENPPKSALSGRRAVVRGSRVTLPNPETQDNPTAQFKIHEVIQEMCRVMPYLAQQGYRPLQTQLRESGVLLRFVGFQTLIEQGDLPANSPQGLRGLEAWLKSRAEEFEMVKDLANPPSTLDLKQVITALEDANRRASKTQSLAK
jgi:hypothetical protein